MNKPALQRVKQLDLTFLKALIQPVTWIKQTNTSSVFYIIGTLTCDVFVDQLEMESSWMKSLGVSISN